MTVRGPGGVEFNAIAGGQDDQFGVGILSRQRARSPGACAEHQTPSGSRTVSGLHRSRDSHSQQQAGAASVRSSGNKLHGNDGAEHQDEAENAEHRGGAPALPD